MSQTDWEIYRELARRVEANERVVRCTIVRAWGSVPREVGAKMLVFQDHSIAGTVGGGCGEAEVWEVAHEVLRDGIARTVHVDLTEDIFSESGKVCGGRFDVFCDLATQEHCGILEQGRLVTDMGPHVPPAWKKSAAAPPSSLPLDRPGTFTVDGRDYFVDVLPQPHDLVIAGAGHVARPLCEIAALCGFQVVIVDDRAPYADPRHFPRAHRVICQDFEEAFDAYPFTPRSHVVLVTRGHKHDQDCLRKMVGRPAAYIGMIGSQRRTRAVFQELEAEGVEKSWLDAVHAPVGLDLRAETPEEIAISILAEIIACRRGGSGRPMKDSKKFSRLREE